MPDVSIVIAAWNAEKFIVRSVRTALAQTGVEVEVLVADDASEDSTPLAVAQLSDRRIRYLRLEQNGGPGAARNAALEAAKGRWILVLDADDYMEPDRAQTLMAAAERAQADLIADNLWIESIGGGRGLFIQEELNEQLLPIPLEPYLRANRLFGKGPALGYLKPLFRTDFLRTHELAYDPKLRIGEDFDLVTRCLVLGARFYRMRTARYVYVVHPGSTSHRLGLDKLRALLGAGENLFRESSDQLTPGERQEMSAYLESLRDGEAFTCMVEALKAGKPADLVPHLLRRPAAIRHFSMPLATGLKRFKAQRAAAPA